MKLSVSLPDDDVAFLDRVAAEEGFPSRSAVLHQAIRLLRSAQLGDAYAQAWSEWADSDGSALWETTSADGMA